MNTSLMKFVRIIILSALIPLLIACNPPRSHSVNYYFDPVSGNDTNTGIAAGCPFKSLARIRTLPLKPGDSVLLKSGALFTEPLFISCRGDSGKPVVVGKYGGTSRPYIKAGGQSNNAVHVYNSEHVVVRDLEISNKGKEPIDGINGVLVEVKNYGTAKDIILDSLSIHDVYGILVRENLGGGNAILLRNKLPDDTVSRPSRFDGLVVQNCTIRDCQRNGIMMWGNWIRSQWYPNLNVVIRHNVIDGVPGDGIVPVACESPLVEYNVMKNCPATLPPSEACDGIWPWSCDNAIIQYNIVSDHKSKVDGYGFDSDWNSTNSVFQYNLSYNNDGGFLLICNSGGWTTDWSFGNKGTRIRYNISINDGLRNFKLKEHYFSPVIHCTGPTENTVIEKNIFYLFKKPDEKTDRTLISLTDWSGYPDSTIFRENYIFAEERYRAADTGKSTRTHFEDNLFVGEMLAFNGFESRPGPFDKYLWYKESDENWTNLLQFIRNKTVTVNGKEWKISDIIGADPKK